MYDLAKVDKTVQYRSDAPMNLDKHPILMQGYKVIQAIEECGASEELTNAVIKASEFLDAVEKLVDENRRLSKDNMEYYSELNFLRTNVL